MATRVTELLGPAPSEPMFAYVVLLENHAPHRCDTTRFESQGVRFKDSADIDQNCALNEYVRRLDSTSAAVRHVESYLGDLESSTGRPFVLLVLGDHQPHTFTATGGFEVDYTALRRDLDLRMTFFHFKSSITHSLACCAVPPPVALLPTLLSSFVANNLDDVYLGENLWLFSRCGADAVSWHFNLGMTSISNQSRDERTQECRAAYRRALASFREAKIVRIATAD